MNFQINQEGLKLSDIVGISEAQFEAFEKKYEQMLDKFGQEILQSEEKVLKKSHVLKYMIDNFDDLFIIVSVIVSILLLQR